MGCQKVGLIDPKNIHVDHDSDSLVFAVIGDYGLQGMNERKVADMVKSWKPDFIITTGDNNYYTGDFSGLVTNISIYYYDYIYNYDAPEEYQCQGKAFREKINRFFPSPGNHDNNPNDHLTPYLNFFTLPGNELTYNFDWGPVSFYSLNSLPDDLEDQKSWLSEQLALSQKPFKVVYFHHPPYSPGQHGNNEKMQWDFKQMGIDAVIAGHDHLYARIDKKGDDGVYYFVNGAGGCNLYSCGENPLDSTKFSVRCFDGNYGAMKGIATTDRLILCFYSIDNRNNLIDRVEIRK